MSQRIHDPTDTGLPVVSTTGTLREMLEKLKDEPEFNITVEKEVFSHVWCFIDSDEARDRRYSAGRKARKKARRKAKSHPLKKDDN